MAVHVPVTGTVSWRDASDPAPPENNQCAFPGVSRNPHGWNMLFCTDHATAEGGAASWTAKRGGVRVRHAPTLCRARPKGGAERFLTVATVPVWRPRLPLPYTPCPTCAASHLSSVRVGGPKEMTVVVASAVAFMVCCPNLRPLRSELS